MKLNLGILGAGSWGITLSLVYHAKGYKITLWEPDFTHAEYLISKRTYKFLPEVKIPPEIKITSHLEEAFKNKNIIILAVPSSYARDVVKKLAQINLNNDNIILSAVKGLEIATFKRMSQVISEELGSKYSSRIAVLSGPTIARELVKKIPTTAVIATKNKKLAKYVQINLMTDYFRLYTSGDVIGVELGGALKNIIAIACGISDGLGLGTNAKAALMTRGLVEITRLGVRLKAQAETFSGLSGMGDLITTCISPYSRNRKFGEKIGQGKPREEALNEIGMVVEGIKTCQATYAFVTKHKIDMPITTEVYNVLFRNKSPQTAVNDLMLRGVKSEALY